MDFISTSTVAAAATALGTDVTTNVESVFVLVILAISIPLAFYILHQIIGLFPHSRGSRR